MNEPTQNGTPRSKLAALREFLVLAAVVVLATTAWHVGVANWRLRGVVFDLALWLAPLIAVLGGWLADRFFRRWTSTKESYGVVGQGLALLVLVLGPVVAYLWWRTIISPLLRPLGAVLGLSCSGWWIGELAVSWRGGSWRPSWRLACGAAWAIVATCGVVSRGLDGDGRGMIAWAWSASDEPAGAPQPLAQRAPATSKVLPGLRDFPAYRGAARDGVASLDLDWAIARQGESKTRRQAPQLLWRASLGAGWSGYVVAGRSAVTQQQLDDGEWLTAQDIANGELLWKTRVGESFSSAGGAGPRATPTIAGPSVLAMSASGKLTCCELDSGKIKWEADVLGQLQSSNRPHGCAASPLVMDGLVVVGGGQLAAASAWDLTDGTLRWSAGEGPDSYCSPQACELLNQLQIVLFTAAEAMGLAPQTGEVLWRFPWGNDMQTNCAQPVRVSDRSLCLSSGYGKGAVLLDLQREGDRWRAAQRWTSTRLQAKFCSPILVRDMLVGLDNGFLTALDVENGRRLWKEGRYGHGQILRVGQERPLLLIQSESGPVHIVQVGREGSEELAQIEPWSGRTWNHPCPAGAYLLLRNDQQAACYLLGSAKAEASN